MSCSTDDTTEKNVTLEEKNVTLDSFLRKELGEALRIGPNLFSERPDAPILRRLRRHLRPGFKVFALCAGYAHIIARLRNPLQDFCLRKEAMAHRHVPLVTQK